MTDPISFVELCKKNYDSKFEGATEELVDALCATFKHVTGKEPSDRVRDEFYNAVRFSQ